MGPRSQPMWDKLPLHPHPPLQTHPRAHAYTKFWGTLYWQLLKGLVTKQQLPQDIPVNEPLDCVQHICFYLDLSKLSSRRGKMTLTFPHTEFSQELHCSHSNYLVISIYQKSSWSLHLAEENAGTQIKHMFCTPLTPCSLIQVARATLTNSGIDVAGLMPAKSH